MVLRAQGQPSLRIYLWHVTVLPYLLVLECIIDSVLHNKYIVMRCDRQIKQSDKSFCMSSVKMLLNLNLRLTCVDTIPIETHLLRARTFYVAILGCQHHIEFLSPAQ